MSHHPVYVYVDGESHFIRTEKKAQQVLGCRSLNEIRPIPHLGHALAVRDDCSFVWLNAYCDRLYPRRKYYFTAYSGDVSLAHEIRTYLREGQLNFDSELIKEDKDKRNNRKAGIEDHALIEKPKGCDIALTVRMIEDAASNNFNTACLFTSDADFIPLIRAVRRMGKHVILFGYKDNLGSPEMLYVADEFVDLSRYIKQGHFELVKPAPVN